MPAPKRRRFEIRQKQRRRVKRKKSIALNAVERKKMFRQKRDGSCIVTARNLSRVGEEHEKNFVEIVLGLSKKFPNEALNVLDEGCGDSSFLSDLQKEVRGRVGINAFKTDLFAHFVSGKVTASPEELVEKFGKNKFHLIVSTHGGARYTSVSGKKAIANIVACLKPGGIASIIINRFSEQALAKVLKNYRNTYFRVEPLSNAASILTITKSPSIRTGSFKK